MFRVRPAVMAGGVALCSLLLLAAPAALASAAVSPGTAGTASATAHAAPAVPAAPAGQARLRPAGAYLSPAFSGDDSSLNGNSCTSTTFCLAGGFFAIQSEDVWPGMSQTWNGTSWTAQYPLPAPAYRSYATIPTETSCTSATSCLLVGEHYRSPSKPAMMAELWSGNGWNLLRWYNPAGTASGVLDDVSCTGPDFCMLVGADQATGKNVRHYTAVYTGNGSASTTAFTAPNPAHSTSSQLIAVSCTSSTSCMATGLYTTAKTGSQLLAYGEQWNGTSWKLVAVPSVSNRKDSILQSVSCSAPGTCVASGYTVSYGKNPVTRPLADTYNGSTWQWSGTPARTSAGFNGISCASTTQCVAAGWSGNGALAEVFNGTSWSVLTTAKTASPRTGDAFNHVSCASTTYCVAVGYRFNPTSANSDHTLAEAWDGTTWTIQPTVNP